MQWLARLTEARAALLATCLVLLAYLPASQTSLVRDLEGDLLDLRFRLEPERPASDEIVLVLIDDASIGEIGRWPWSRAVIADLVSRIGAGGAATIGVDLLFAEPETAAVPAPLLDALSKALPRHGAGDGASGTDELARVVGRLLESAPGDEALAAALAKVGNVIVPFPFEFGATSQGPPAAPYVAANAYRIVRTGTDGAGDLPTATGLLPPVAAIGEAAALGHSNLALGPDGAARFEYPAIVYRGDYYPSFAIEVARQHLGVPRDRTSLLVGRGVQLGERFVATDARTRLVVTYAVPGRFPRISAASLPEPEARRAEDFRAALAAWRAGDLGAALGMFERLSEARPDDHPALVYVRRCRARLQGRPDPGDPAP
jgi:CHASE2 domain-containing sensor protein